jgi:pilus assembly protein FimV
MLSQMSELSLEPEKPQSDDDLGVDLDLEELSRFRNIGNHEEQVNNDASHPASQPQESYTENPSQFSAPLSEFDLDEPKSEAEASEAAAATGSFSPMTAETEGPWNDVATKLDLARAYQATGDVEACREILQEVLKEGDDQQKAEAQKILASL